MASANIKWSVLDVGAEPMSGAVICWPRTPVAGFEIAFLVRGAEGLALYLWPIGSAPDSGQTNIAYKCNATVELTEPDAAAVFHLGVD